MGVKVHLNSRARVFHSSVHFGMTCGHVPARSAKRAACVCSGGEGPWWREGGRPPPPMGFDTPMGRRTFGHSGGPFRSVQFGALPSVVRFPSEASRINFQQQLSSLSCVVLRFYSLGAVIRCMSQSTNRDDKHGTRTYLPQPNGTAYSFGNAINVEWKHGINALPFDEQAKHIGRIAIIVWGWASIVETRVLERKRPSKSTITAKHEVTFYVKSDLIVQA